MTITIDQLGIIMPLARRSGRAAKYIDNINKYMQAFEINTPLRAAHFLAQIAHESGELAYTEENLNYRASALLSVFPKYFNSSTAPLYAGKPQKIANRVYANRLGNGSEASGDGWKYRGRGFIQLTGKSNYEKYKAFCGYDVVKNPDLLSGQPGCIRSACWFWHTHKLNASADHNDLKAITKAINGGTNGLSSRQTYLTRALKAFQV